MSSLGRTLFTASPFIRWTISPFLFLTMVILPLTIQSPTPQGILVLAGLEFIGLFLLLGLWTRGAIQIIAFRVVTGFVVIAYLAYLIYEIFISGTPLTIDGARSEASPKNSLIGFVLIGLPCLWFTLFGRFTLSPERDVTVTDSDSHPSTDENKNG